MVVRVLLREPLKRFALLQKEEKNHMALRSGRKKGASSALGEKKMAMVSKKSE